MSAAASSISAVVFSGSSHLVVAVERRDVPRNVGRHAGDELGQAHQFVARVVEPGNQQRDDLDPEVHRVQPPDGVENRREPSAELAVVAIVEALEIDFVEIDPRPQVLEHLRRAVAVRHEAGRRDRPPSLP